MTKIRVHRYENELWGRAHLPFFKKFDEHLKKYFEIDVVNYNKDGQTFSGPINLQSDISTFGKNPSISDVEYIIENIETKDIKVISFTEFFNHYVSHFVKSENCSNVLLAHFNWNYRFHWVNRERSIESIDKVRPWIFLTFKEFDYDLYREKRKQLNLFEDKMFYLGSGIDGYRKSVLEVESMGYLQKIGNYDFNDYLDKLINSKIGLSHYMDLDKCTNPFEYPGEMCYRDIEYMSVGLPFIRIEYKDSLHDPLIANHHYISIPRENAYVAYERNGDKGVAELYVKKFKEVKENKSFLDFISKNQTEWFDKNIKSPNKENLTFDLLGLKKWLN